MRTKHRTRLTLAAASLLLPAAPLGTALASSAPGASSPPSVPPGAAAWRTAQASPGSPQAATPALKARLAAAEAALQSGDFETARRDVTAFHDAWDGPVERDVKARLKAEYDRYEGAEESLTKHLLEKTAPDKARALGAVQTIHEVLDRYSALNAG